MYNVFNFDISRVRLSFLFSVPIGIVGGMIGLGGAEFRLPVLAGPLNYQVRRAIPINLTISLVTLIVSLIIRGSILHLNLLYGFSPLIISMIIGGMIAAFFGAGVAHRIDEGLLEKIILVLLVFIGALLIIEAFLPHRHLMDCCRQFFLFIL